MGDEKAVRASLLVVQPLAADAADSCVRADARGDELERRQGCTHKRGSETREMNVHVEFRSKFPAFLGMGIR